MKENYQINLPAGTNELIIREGKAKEIEVNKQIYQECELTSLTSFISKRLEISEAVGEQTLGPADSLIIVNRDQGKITLNISPAEERGTKIIGKLAYNPDLLPFNINAGSYFSRESLVKLLRFSRRFFKDHLVWEETLKKLQALTVGVNANITNETDTRGNKNVAFQKVLTTSAPLSFSLTMPIFKGVDASTFSVDICLETTESSVKFWLESIELDELTQNIKNLMFDKVLEPLKEHFVILYE